MIKECCSSKECPDGLQTGLNQAAWGKRKLLDVKKDIQGQLKGTSRESMKKIPFPSAPKPYFTINLHAIGSIKGTSPIFEPSAVAGSLPALGLRRSLIGMGVSISDFTGSNGWTLKLEANRGIAGFHPGPNIYQKHIFLQQKSTKPRTL